MKQLDQTTFVYIVLVVIAIILLLYIFQQKEQISPSKLKGVWYMPNNIIANYGLSQYILYFGENGDGYMVLVDDNFKVLYNDQIKYTPTNNKLQIETEQFIIFKKPMEWTIKTVDQQSVLKIHQGDENLGIFINVK